MATPLGAADEAAHKARWGEEVSGMRLHVSVQDAMRTYFSGRGEKVSALPWALEGHANDEAWVRRWTARLHAAGISDEGDEEDFILWLRARLAPKTSGNVASNQVQVVLEALESNGVLVPVAAAAAAQLQFSASENASEQEQCVGAKCAYIILTGKAPSAKQSFEYEEQKASLGSGAIVDLLNSEEYRKMTKATSTFQLPILERAIKSEAQFNEWQTRMGRMLHTSGLPKAAFRLQEVVGAADAVAKGDWSVKATYLHHYFFYEHRGLGLPVKKCSESMGAALTARGSPALKTSVVKPSFDGSDAASVASSQGSELSSALSSASTLESVVSSAVASALKPVAEKLETLEQRIHKMEKSCKFCGRSWCPMLKGGAPCREAIHAAGSAREADKE